MEFSRQKLGVTLSHIAVLALLVSAGLNYLYSQEGYVLLAEGEHTQAMRSYTAHDFTVLHQGKPVYRQPLAALYKGQHISTGALPFAFEITRLCDHCEAFTPREASHRKGLAQKITLRPSPMPLQKEEALAGLEFRLNGKDYVSFAALPSRFPVIQWQRGAAYQFRVERRQTALPFAVTLLDFEKTTYPGTDAAQEYESLVSINGEQHAIRMNEPYRAKGVALYQSSYLRRGNQQASVLAVVINPFWWTPYAAGLLLLLGLGWQMIFRLVEGKNR